MTDIININHDKKQENNDIIKLIKDEYDEEFDFNKPFLKWVGGKTQIINNIIKEFPIEMNNYHEIFLGGGSILIAVLILKNNGIINIKKNIYAYDYNKPLIYLYKNIQKKCIKFLKSIAEIINEYNEIDGDIINRKPSNIEEAKTSQESYYYWIRQKYNEMDEEEQLSILGSSYFLFLNKTCFRGVFRLGPNGFNVPFGHYVNPSIIDIKHIKNISKLIKDVYFIHSSFEDSLKKVKKGSYVYLDPPYKKLNNTSFVGYSLDGFSEEQHDKLFNILYKLKNKNINWMMSNSSATEIFNIFGDEKLYTIIKILCKRTINSKNPNDKVNEVIIKSY